MRFSILTLFPEYFNSPLSASILGRAVQAGQLQFDYVSLREFGEGKYRAVDDKPYGGGAGMVMMAPVLERALTGLLGSDEELTAHEARVQAYRQSQSSNNESPHVVFLSPQGKKLTAAIARQLSQKKHVVLVCGHYEGIDERAVDAFVHEEISIGDYILTGGEPAAVVLIDSVSRFVPGVVGEAASVSGDTFESPDDMQPGGLKYPVFTRPAQWRGRDVPKILLSGNHGEIAKWRKAESHARTAARRPDLLK